MRSPEKGYPVEPLIKEASGRTKEDMRADLSVQGVWEETIMAFFDDCIVNADAPGRLLRNLSWKSALKSAANEKRPQYRDVCEDK